MAGVGEWFLAGRHLATSWLSVRAGGFGIGSAGVMGDGAPPSDTWRSWKGPGLGLAWAAGPSFGLCFGLLFWHLTSFGLSLSKMPLSLISSTKPHLFILHFSSTFKYTLKFLQNKIN